MNKDHKVITIGIGSIEKTDIVDKIIWDLMNDGDCVVVCSDTTLESGKVDKSKLKHALGDRLHIMDLSILDDVTANRLLTEDMIVEEIPQGESFGTAGTNKTPKKPKRKKKPKRQPRRK